MLPPPVHHSSPTQRARTGPGPELRAPGHHITHHASRITHLPRPRPRPRPRPWAMPGESCRLGLGLVARWAWGFALACAFRWPSPLISTDARSFIGPGGVSPAARARRRLVPRAPGLGFHVDADPPVGTHAPLLHPRALGLFSVSGFTQRQVKGRDAKLQRATTRAAQRLCHGRVSGSGCMTARLADRLRLSILAGLIPPGRLRPQSAVGSRQVSAGLLMQGMPRKRALGGHKRSLLCTSPHHMRVAAIRASYQRCRCRRRRRPLRPFHNRDKCYSYSAQRTALASANKWGAVPPSPPSGPWACQRRIKSPRGKRLAAGGSKMRSEARVVRLSSVRQRNRRRATHPRVIAPPAAETRGHGIHMELCALRRTSARARSLALASRRL